MDLAVCMVGKHQTTSDEVTKRRACPDLVTCRLYQYLSIQGMMKCSTLPVPEDDAELPSKSVQLLPEFTQDPWLLEQGWTLDHCTDEKSRAAIEKMLLEEQQFSDGKVVKGNIASKSEPTSLPKTKTSGESGGGRRSTWKEDEQSLFYQGYEIYGRRWAKIAELIPSKTCQQVKNFAVHHLKHRLQEQTSGPGPAVRPAVSDVTSLDDTLRIIKTGTTTMTLPATTQRGRQRGRPPAQRKNVLTQARARGNQGKTLQKRVNSAVLSEVVRICPKSESEDEDVNIESDSDQEIQTPVRPELGHSLSSESDGGPPLDVTDTHSDCGQNDNTPLDTSSEIEQSNEVLEIDSCVDNIISEDAIDKYTRGVLPEGTLLDLGISDSLICDEQNEQKLTYLNGICRVDAASSSQDTYTLGHVVLARDTVSSSDEISIECENIELEKDLILKDPTPTCGTDNTPQHSEGILLDGKEEFSLQAHGQGVSEEYMESFEFVDNQEATSRTVNSDENKDSSSDESDHLDEFGVLTSDGGVVYLPNPTSPVTPDRDNTTEEERQIHYEFFSDKSGTKNADRYLRIRNHILDCWDKCKPSYLNKTSVRVGLRHCGDVNCIGRIHSYLEQMGAINFGCEQAQYNNPVNRPHPKPTKKVITKEYQQAIAVARMESMRPRKRRVKDGSGEWIDEKELEGKTIEHQTDNDDGEDVKKSKQKRSSNKNSYDPFQLIPCYRFTEDHIAPFSVTIEIPALVVMDIHAHLSKTEVIGLLGGQYLKDQGTLVVMTAEPCDSLSTGMQCEMDPVSQTCASERILAANQNVVGWYHSHPMFAANPSIRDMETQLDFQDWFAMGGSAFIGIIVSPYNRHVPSLSSDVKCLVVERDNNGERIGSPFQFDFDVKHTSVDAQIIEEQSQRLAQKYVDYTNRVDLFKLFPALGNISCLEKMLRSLEYHLMSQTSSEDELSVIDKLRMNINQIFNHIYGNKGL